MTGFDLSEARQLKPVLWRKLLLLLLACVFSVAGLGVLAVVQLDRLSDQQAQLSRNVLPSYSLLNSIRSEYIALLRKTTEVVNWGKEEKTGAGLAEIAEHERKLQEQLLIYQSNFVLNEQDGVRLSEVRAAVGEATAIIHRAMDLVADGRREEAQSLVKEKSPTVFAVLAALDRHTASNADAVRQGIAEVQVLKRRLELQGSLVAACLVGLLCLMALMLSRSVLKPLYRIRQRVIEMGRGDFDSPIPGAGRNDEVGEIGDALDALRVALALSEARELNKDVIARLVERLQGKQDFREFADELLQVLMVATDGDYAAFHVAHGRQSSLTRIVSLGGRSDDDRETPWGHGLVGMAAQRGQVLRRHSPAERPASLTAGGQTLALRHVCALPVIKRGEVVAVLELAFLEEPPARTSALLDMVGEPLALLMELLERDIETCQMLSVSLKQAEALQAQRGELESRQAELVALNGTLIEKGAQLGEARDAAEAAARAKADFLANMSHEIRTPMNAVIGMAHLALGARNQDECRDHVARILRAGKHLLGVLNEILDFSKLDAGAVKLEAADFHPRQVLRDVEDMFAAQCAEKGLSLRFKAAPEVPDRLRGDAVRLGQILINYVGNAVKFTEHGGIHVGVRMEADDPLRLRFEVTDTGVGLSADDQARLFQSFEQADSSTTRRFGGTGLGLVISKRLALLMGGEVGVVSEPGRGSTFWFTAGFAAASPLPSAGAAAAEAFRSPMPALQGRRVLLVEDNPLNQKVARGLLEARGVVVETADDGAEALRLAQARGAGHGFDVVLMDMKMPVMDGPEATRAMREVPGWRDTPILAMTANTGARERDICAAAGMNGFIAKPVEPDLLYAAIAEALDTRIEVPGAPPHGAAGSGVAAVAPSGDPLRCIDGLDVSQGLTRVLGHRETYESVLRSFASGQREAAREMQKALHARDPQTAERIAHTLKALAGTIGAGKLAAQCRSIESALQEGDLAAAGRAIASITRPLDALVAALVRVLPEVGSGPVPIADLPAAQARLSQLESMLAGGEAQARAFANEHAGLLAASYGEPAGRLIRLVKAFRFDEAIDVLHSLRANPGAEVCHA